MELFGYGTHLILDGYHANAEKIADEHQLATLLENIPVHLGLTVVAPPQVYTIKNQAGQTEGVSGVVLLAESHLAIHTFVQQRCVNVALFSCQNFDAPILVDCISKSLDLGRAETSLTARGKEYPRNLERVARIVQGEREYAEARLIP